MACKNQLKQGRLNFASEDTDPLKEHELRGPTIKVLARCAKVYAAIALAVGRLEVLVFS
jgi:hypothetical protein